MSQSKKMSVVESIANIVIGSLIALATQIIVFPLYDIHPTHSDNIQMWLIFTAVSLIRSYSLRRIFNMVREK